MIPFDEILSKLEKVREIPCYSSELVRTFKACCPAHDDNNPSLNISENNEGAPVFHCWAGCNNDDVIHALGYRWPELMPDRDLPEPTLRTVEDMENFLMVALSARRRGEKRKASDRALEIQFVRTLARKGKLPEWYA